MSTSNVGVCVEDTQLETWLFWNFFNLQNWKKEAHIVLNMIYFVHINMKWPLVYELNGFLPGLRIFFQFIHMSDVSELKVAGVYYVLLLFVTRNLS